MTKQTASRYQRRTRPEWKQIIDEFEDSDASAAQFCDKHSLSYQSFSKWRSTFNVESRKSNDDFIELTPNPASKPSIQISTDWSIELELPGGVTLKVRAS